jgi:site-specific recombinase XerC
MQFGEYTRCVCGTVPSIGLDPAKFGTHSLRRTKVVLIDRRTGNLRAVQLLLGHSKIESTVRYLGIEAQVAHTAGWSSRVDHHGDQRSAPSVSMPRTSLGSHMLAVSEDVMAAQLMGIRP